MKILNLLFLTLLLLNFSSEKEMDLGSFSMKTPKDWTYIKQRGIDSFVGKIAIGKNDTLYFDYGLYSNNLEESFNNGYYYIINNDSIFTPDWELSKLDTINEPIYKFFARGGKTKLNEFIENTSYEETINGLKAKIVVPINAEKGTTGVYFENTSTNRKGMKFQISGYNLKEENQKAFLRAIKTLKFKH
ncbi:hypothetical protein [Flavobacterium marginilacus]|uniref:hypothetical protein n=1 Tax=Flavobacterium marginilacus TaxID=3003256 RepID=UPI00248DFB32|nr:hypothetical protein [Flavobacterium marginilacus]